MNTKQYLDKSEWAQNIKSIASDQPDNGYTYFISVRNNFFQDSDLETPERTHERGPKPELEQLQMCKL